MIAFLRTVRKLVLGETWVVPIGVACAIAVAAVGDAVGGGHAWWHRGGGYVLLAMVVAVLLVSTRAPRR